MVRALPPNVTSPAKRFVDEAVVEKILVVVAFVATRAAMVPRDVREDVVIPEARVLPVNEPAGAEPVIEPAMALVTVRSVKKPAVSLVPVAPREPVDVMLLTPKASCPPRETVPPVSMVRIESDEVEKVCGLDVAIYRTPDPFLIVQ
jgi:hypothetical protein